MLRPRLRVQLGGLLFRSSGRHGGIAAPGGSGCLSSGIRRRLGNRRAC